MSLKHTDSTQHWNTIPKKCKNCNKAIYTIEDGEVFYQCNMFGKFKKDCQLKVSEQTLLKPNQILNGDNDGTDSK